MNVFATVVIILTAMLSMDLEVLPVGAFTPVHSLGGESAAFNKKIASNYSANNKAGPRSKVVGSFTVTDETTSELISTASKPTPADLQVAILTRRAGDRNGSNHNIMGSVSITTPRRRATSDPRNKFISQTTTAPRNPVHVVHDKTSFPTATGSSIAATKRNLRSAKMIRPKSRKRNISVRQQQQKKHLSRGKVSYSAYGSRTLPEDNDYDYEDDGHVDSSMENRLLSRDEERDITHRIRDLRVAVRIRDQLVQESTANTPTEQEWADACGLSVLKLRGVIQDGQQARTVLVSSNVGLVTSIAKRHYYALKQATGGVGTILTLQDMIQEGNLGLMKAAERFEPERGFKFSTYATYWIRQRILQSISDCSRVIRLPAHGQFCRVRFSSWFGV